MIWLEVPKVGSGHQIGRISVAFGLASRVRTIFPASSRLELASFPDHSRQSLHAAGEWDSVAVVMVRPR